eukprot:XP_011611096.1 PREDICTED: cytochrome P450 3A30-like isoform X1 [Takifugu rubripes]
MNYLPLFALETWILLITFTCLFVMYGKRTFGIFEKLGISGPKPTMYFGSICKYNNVYYLDDQECAQKYGKIWGTYELRKPMLVVMDPDLLKTILVKECFTHFTNRRNFCLNGDLYDAVNIAEDDDWRRIRNVLSPLFTTGRIKQIFSLMKRQSSKLTSSLEPKAENEEIISIKDFFGAYNMNVATGVLFGMEMEPSLPIKHASKLFKFPIPLFMIQGCFPILLPLLQLMGFSLFPRDSFAFVKKIVEKIRAERDGGSHQVCTGRTRMLTTYTSTEFDFLQHMISTQKNDGLTDHEIVSQLTVLLTGGYETSTLALTLSIYSLATNPGSMNRLQEEIDATFPDAAPVTYEALMQMEYVDCVINECLRLYPPAARLERTAKETVEISGITIPKNMTVTVPIFALHRDPEHWPEPEEFKPDRFSKQNKGRINPYTYLPFGIGPRKCLGMRLALVIVKLALVETLQKYSFSVCKETEIPFKMDPNTFVGPINPIKLRVVRR